MSDAAKPEDIEALAEHLRNGFMEGEHNGRWLWPAVATSALQWRAEQMAARAKERDYWKAAEAAREEERKQQTAALREENARLRGALRQGLSLTWLLDMAASHTATREWEKQARALLADPEGQRAGGEWRALDTLYEHVKAARDWKDDRLRLIPSEIVRQIRKDLAAIERARQP